MNFIGRQPAEKLVAMATHKGIKSSDGDWYVDTGASHHIMSELGNLQISAPYQGSEAVQVGNGEQLPISNIGKTSFLLGNRVFHLNDILHCPSAPYNLLSVKEVFNTRKQHFSEQRFAP